MAGFRDRYATDRNLEEEGVWVDFGDGLKVKIRRLSSKTSRETRRKLEKPYAAQFRNREMPDSLQDELLNKQVAQAIVLDWEGVEDPTTPAPAEGKTAFIDCTPENVLKVITALTDFRDDILTAAMERTTFEKEQREKGSKNS